MATTDARTGFRLPWSSDQRPADGSADGDETRTDGPTPHEAQLHAQPGEADSMTPAVDTATEVQAGGATTAPTPPLAQPAPPTGGSKKPSKFMADLTKAMQAAAEGAREETLARLQADAKAHVEGIHSQSANEAADLRRRADDDVAEIREWSKAEIARIREETETRIAGRKRRLEAEIDEHAAFVEGQIERVQARVGTFEQEMASFFERLLAEEDPTRFAAMAGTLPEPPAFDDDLPAFAPSDDATRPEPVADITPEATPIAPVTEAVEAPVDTEAAMAAIQAAAEAAEAQAASEALAPEMMIPSDDPRLAALGMSPDFEAAEAEAFAAAGSDEEIEIPTIAEDALASRLAGLVPAAGEAAPAPSPTTQVVVTGLVSVASIASFKRHLGRLPGVQSVGVSSGPEGEFIFTVAHGEEVNLRDAVPSLPGFQARVTGGSDEMVEVVARDPENEA